MNKLNDLEQILGGMGPLAVAVSGGVDSMTLAYVAHRVNPESTMFHAVSPAVPVSATERVREYAAREGWRLEEIHAGEIDDPDYVANPANRCYFCKTNLYDTICTHTTLTVVSGTNTDDLGDYRPGLKAAEEHDVRHPWVEAGISKAELRAIAGSLGLHDLEALPAAPCLSSRVTTGIAINADLLPVINEVEEALWRKLPVHLPLTGVRCRIREDGVAIEIESGRDVEIGPKATFAQMVIDTVQQQFALRGFADEAKTVSLEPYRRGSAFLIETLAVQ